jgi:HEAT repeat protein
MRNAGNTAVYFACSLSIVLLGSCAKSIWSGRAMRDDVQAQIDCLMSEISEDEDEDASRAAHSQAAEQLVKFGHQNPKVINRIIECLNAGRRNARFWAASILLRIGPKANAAIPRLVQILEDREEDDGVRGVAGGALGFMGPDAIPVLGKLLNESKDAYVRRKAADAFCRHCEYAKEAVPLLLRGVRDPDREVRLNTVSSLVAFGQPGVPMLVDALAKEPISAKLYIAEALSKIDVERVPEMVPILLDGIELSDADDRAQAAWTFSELAEKRRNLVSVLDEATVQRMVKSLAMHLRNDDSRVRSAAAQTLGSCGVEAQQAVSDLVQCLSDNDWLVRGWGVRSLARIGRPAKQVVTALTQALSDQETEVRGAAVDGLGDLGIDAAGALDALGEALRRNKDDHEMAVRIRLAISKITTQRRR